MTIAFDPVLIFYQMVCFQCFYYFSVGTLLGLFHAVFDINVSLRHIFTPKYINFVTSHGLIETTCTLVASVVG
jgi:hypothetical protein